MRFYIASRLENAGRVREFLLGPAYDETEKGVTFVRKKQTPDNARLKEAMGGDQHD